MLELENNIPSTVTQKSLPNIDQEPLQSQASNIVMNRLKQTSTSRVEVQMAWQIKLFAFTFLLAGLLALGAFLFDTFVSSLNLEHSWIALLIAMVVIPISCKMLLTYCVAGFDKKIGYYWQGGNVHKLSQVKRKKEYAELSDIIAIQVLEAIDSMEDWVYYELNLVFSDGDRTNIMRHTGKNIKTDGRMLARFLNVPLV